jgi:hypothetical protein
MTPYRAKLSGIAMAFSLASAAAHAGEISKIAGAIPDALGTGFKFVTGSELGPQKDQQVQLGAVSSKATTRTGSIYLAKNNELLVCRYTIVETNPSRDDEDYLKPSSVCYKIK